MSKIEEGSDALLMDGRIVHVRPVREEDKEALTSLYARTSPRTRYLRFFSAGISIDREVERLMPGDDHVALIAEHDGVVVGVASYEILNSDQAELALLVDDAWQGDGIGSLLMEHLSAIARRAGISELLGDVLATNVNMLRTTASLAPGIARDHDEDPGVVRVHIPTQPDEQALAAAGARDRTAEHNSLRPLLAPASLAIIGVSGSRTGVGYQILQSVLASGFTGRTYPVNPRTKIIDELQCYPSISAIPERVDLALIAVPAAHVEQVVEECGTAGVRAAVVLSAGFGETEPSGEVAEARLLATARRHDIRLVGPNCIGLINTDPSVRLNATFAAEAPLPGHLAVASQSGAVGIAILDSAERCGVGISTFVSLGNKIDVSTNDLLAYWYDDISTQAVALYVESFGNPRRFGWLARALSTRKPILAVKSGRSAGGRRAGTSDTAAAAALDIVVDTVFRQAGVLRMETLGELLDAARLLTEQPLPAGDRVAIIGNAGGLNVLAADAAEAAGLKVVEFSAALRHEQDDLAMMGRAVRALGSSGEADALVINLVGTRTDDLPGALAALSDAADEQPQLPIVAVVVGGSSPLTLGRRNVPVYGLPEDAVRALGHACRYARWRRKPTGSRPTLPGIDRQAAQKIISGALSEGVGWQPATVARALMSCYGVPLLETRLATGVELVIGLVHNALFGSLIMVGWGGVHTDLLSDRSFRSVPLTDQDAADMWQELRAAPLLTGYRGLPAMDTAALEELLLRIAQLAEDFPEISELDLNPVVSVPGGVAALDVKIKLQPRMDEPDPYIRSLATRRGERK